MNEDEGRASNLAAADIFCDWFDVGVVRNRPYSYDASLVCTSDLTDRHWFLPGLLPWLEEDVIRNRGEAARQELLARALVFFLDYTTTLEIKIVNRAVTTIALDELGMGIPQQIKMAGLQLYTDEAYHAVISADVSNQIAKRYTIGNRDVSDERVFKLSALIHAVDEEYRSLAWFVVGFVSETVITKEFLTIAESTIVEPVLNMLRDHLSDELKHTQYFSHVFHYIWERSSDSQKKFIGQFLPTVIWEFFRLHSSWLLNNLLLIGIDHSNAFLIHERLQTDALHRKRAQTGSAATFAALRRSGYLKSSYNLKKLIDAGILNGR